MIKLKKSKDRQWYFIVVARNGRTLVTSETYRTKQNAIKGINALRTVFDKPTDVFNQN